MAICLLPSSQLWPCKHPSKSDTPYCFLWQYVWIKLRIGMPKWICQRSRKCNYNLFAVWAMEWEPDQLYRYSYLESVKVRSQMFWVRPKWPAPLAPLNHYVSSE